MGKWTTEAQIDRARQLREAGMKLADIAADVIEHARQHCATALPLIRRIRGAL